MNDARTAKQDAVILLVEDDDTDAFLTREAFDRCGAQVSIHRVDNGEKCIAFLRRAGHADDAPTPDLVLLDLNLPVMDGREVLRTLDADRALPPVPVVVLSTSRIPADISTAYLLGCSSYVAKPLDIDEFDSIVRDLWTYWFSTVLLPAAPGPAP